MSSEDRPPLPSSHPSMPITGKPAVNLQTKPKLSALPAMNGSKGGPVRDNSLNGSNGTNLRVLKPEGHVGIDSLPEQFVNRIVRDGFGFNIMVLGHTGVGKSTLLDSLFNMKFPDVSTRNHNLSAVDVTSHTYDLQERNIKLKLGLIESRGYGDQINRGQPWFALHKSFVIRYN